MEECYGFKKNDKYKTMILFRAKLWFLFFKIKRAPSVFLAKTRNFQIQKKERMCLVNGCNG
jgi:hypothetical protein